MRGQCKTAQTIGSKQHHLYLHGAHTIQAFAGDDALIQTVVTWDLQAPAVVEYYRHTLFVSRLWAYLMT